MNRVARYLGWHLLVLPFLWLSGAFSKLAADDVIPVFISTENWTPFFWGSSRQGSLIPLLGSIVQDPVSNLRFQTVIHAMFLILSLTLISKLIFTDESYEIPKRVTTVFIMLTLIGWNPDLLVPMINNLPYGVSLGLFLVVIQMRFINFKSNLFVEIGLVLITCWLNPIILIFVIPVLVFYYKKETRQKLNRIVILCTLFGLMFLFIGRLNGERSGLAIPDFGGILQKSWVIPLVISQIIALGLMLYDRKRENTFRKKTLTLFVASCSCWVTIFILPFSVHLQGEMQGSKFATRYFAISTILGIYFALAAVFILITRPFNLPRLGSGRLTFVVALTLALLTLLNLKAAEALKNTYPLIPSTYLSLEKTLMEFRGGKINFLSGDYWYTWPLKMQLLSDHSSEAIVTSLRFESQNTMRSRRDFGTKIFDTSTGICFGELVICKEQLTTALEIHMENFFTIELIKGKEIDLGDVVATLVTLQIKQSNTRCFLGSQLPTQIGSIIDNDLFAISGTEGYLSFGPFIRLSVGSYNYSINLRTDRGKALKIGYVDVAVNSGPLKLSKQYFDQSETGMNKVDGKFSSTKSEPKSIYEVRVYSFGKTTLGVKKLCLEKNRTENTHN